MLAFELSHDPTRPAGDGGSGGHRGPGPGVARAVTAGPHGNVIRMLPPLVITDAELDRGLDAIARAVAKPPQRGGA